MSVVESHKNYNPRLRIFYFVAAAVCLVLIGGLAKHQIFDNAEYRSKEVHQNQRRVLIPAPRGSIFDREGRLLVGNRPRFSAVISLAGLRSEFRREYIELVRKYREEGAEMKGRSVEIEARANVVQRYLDQINEATGRAETVDPRELDRHFFQRRILPFKLVSDLDHAEFARIVEQIPRDSHIQLETASARHYPHGSTAAHVLGYVSSTQELEDENLPGDTLMTFILPGTVGRTGLERHFNEQLAGKTGSEIWIVDPSGYRYGDPVERIPPVKGEDIFTSIDIDIQQSAENGLGNRVGAAVAIDIHTGEILAMTSKPDYDLNSLTPFIPTTVFQEIEEKGGWTNRTLQGLYPPGSTFKLVTALAALRSGAITPETTSYCAGSYMVGRRAFPCHSRAGHGQVDLAAALKTSCNVFFYEHGLTTGIEAIAAEARRFGFDEKTGVELPFESGRMVVPDPAWKKAFNGQSWFPGDTANVSIGQGYLLSSPLQVAQFTASLARNETATRLTLLRQPRGMTPVENRKPIGLPPELIAEVLQGMEEAVLGGTARFAALPDVQVAGKTGTAQVRVRNGTLHLAWFAGFAPLHDPKIAIAIMVEGTEIDDRYAGGTTAAPIAREIFRTYFEKNPPRPHPDLASQIP